MRYCGQPSTTSMGTILSRRHLPSLYTSLRNRLRAVRRCLRPRSMRSHSAPVRSLGTQSMGMICSVALSASRTVKVMPSCRKCRWTPSCSFARSSDESFRQRRVEAPGCLLRAAVRIEHLIVVVRVQFVVRKDSTPCSTKLGHTASGPPGNVVEPTGIEPATS